MPHKDKSQTLETLNPERGVFLLVNTCKDAVDFATQLHLHAAGRGFYVYMNCENPHGEFTRNFAELHGNSHAMRAN